MLWELSVTEQRYRAVLEVMAGRYEVSRQSVHTWLRRYRDEGPLDCRSGLRALSGG
jgi:predicted transcriptional regulator